MFGGIYCLVRYLPISQTRFLCSVLNTNYPSIWSTRRSIMPPKRKAPTTKPVSEAPEEKKSKNLEKEVSESVPDKKVVKGGRDVEASSKKNDNKQKKQVKENGEPAETSKEPSKGNKRQPQKVAKAESEEDADSEEEVKEVTAKKPKATRGKKEAAPSKTLLNQTETLYAKLSFACNRKNKLGKTSNFCISNWNVDGLRAWLKKDGLTYLEYEKPDIFCIQESKCSTEKLPSEVTNLKDYKQYWHNSTKEGYAGVGLFSRSEPLSVNYGIGDEEQDEEGRCITAEFDKFYVVSVYVPNAGRKLVTLPKRLDWNIAFKKFIKNLDKKKPVIVCGDMNVAHGEIDLANPKTNTKNAGFTKEERDGMTDFLADEYVDTFRSFYPDEKDAYTFWSYMSKARAKNVGWRLDYFIVSKRFLDNVCDNVIRSEVYGSDHCPIALFLNK